MFVPGNVRDEVLKLAAAGIPSAHIAQRLGVAQSTVHYHLRRQERQAESVARIARRTGPKAPAGAMRAVVGALLEQGVARAEIALRLGLSKSTVSYHAAELGKGVAAGPGRRYDWEAVQAFYDEGHSVGECADLFGFSRGSWHDAVLHGHITPRPAFQPLEQIFAANTNRHRGHLKRRLLAAGIKQDICEICGISQWCDAPLALTLHHINGDRHDNRLENLQLLCPNCHSQTDTFGGRRRNSA